MLRLFNVSVLVLALGLTACSSSRGGQPAPTPAWPAEADTAVRAAIQDMATRLHVKPEAVQVMSVSTTDWSDTSLGCPQPGMFYAQIIVQGYTIILTSGGQPAEYHADQKGRVVTCGR